jgi:trigger factor
LSTTIEDISSTKKRLKIEIPLDVITKEYNSSLNNVRQRAKIPGFRPGKVPVNLIEKRFADNIKSDIIDRLVPEYYSKALKDAGLTPVTMPTLETSVELKKNEPLSISLTVEVRPNITDLNYEGMKIEDVDVRVDDAELEDTLIKLQDERAVYSEVDRPIKEDDFIVIDYVKLDAAGEKELSSGKDQVMNLGNNLTPKGILDELIGKKKGDLVEIDIPASVGSSEGSDLKEEGEGSRIRITVKEVKEKKLPEMDDEFAKDLGHDTLESLRNKVGEGILKAKKDGSAKEQKAKLLDMLVESHDFDVPESLFERELENLYINEKASMKQAPDLLEKAEDETPGQEEDDAQLKEKLKPKAAQNIKGTILLDMIAEKENITVSEDELKTKIMQLAQHFQTNPENIMNLFITRDGSLENLKHSIRDEKVLEIILSKAELIKGE